MNINADGGEYVEKGWQMHLQGHKVDSRGRNKSRVRANDDFKFWKKICNKGKVKDKEFEVEKERIRTLEDDKIGILSRMMITVEQDWIEKKNVEELNLVHEKKNVKELD